MTFLKYPKNKADKISKLYSSLVLLNNRILRIGQTRKILFS